MQLDFLTPEIERTGAPLDVMAIMSTLTELEVSQLRERGFQDVRAPEHAEHWRGILKQPVAFFYNSPKDTFTRELDRRQIPYRANRSKSELQQLLLDAETDCFRVICRDAVSGMHDVVFPVHRNASIGTLLQHYNREATKARHPHQFTSITCEGQFVAPSIRMHELASIWQSSHQGIERNIILLDAQ